MEALKDKVTQQSKIKGSSVINHEVRRKLGISCDLYVFMDYIYDCVQKKREVNIPDTFEATGFDVHEQKELLSQLVKKDFIYPITSPIPRITSLWSNAFSDFEKEFELFWNKVDKDKSLKVCWPGSKKKAFEKFRLARKSKTLEFLIAQRNAYFDYLEMEQKRGFNRQKMIAERWLNPKNEHYDEDWNDYANQIRKQLGEPIGNKPKEVLTKDKLKELYAENSDK